MIDSAATDLPLPDSPTRPSVSPARISKLTSSTAGTGPRAVSNTVVRCSTRSSAPSAIGPEPSAISRSHLECRCLRVLAEDVAHRVGDFADRRARLDRGDDRRHEVAAVARGLRDRGARGAQLAGAADRAPLPGGGELVPLDFRLAGQPRPPGAAGAPDGRAV